MPEPPPTPTLSAIEQVHVARFRFVGNTVFDASALAAVVREHVARTLTAEQLEAARLAVTRHYVDHGYLTSGARIPDQVVTDGTVTMEIVEGRLGEVRVESPTRLRESWLVPRVRPEGPLRMDELAARLRLLEDGPLVARVDAELAPGPTPGESVLRLRVEDERPYGATVAFDNHRSPSIGAERFTLTAWHHDLSGRGDTAHASVALDSGFDNHVLGYAIPLGPSETTLGIEYESSDSTVVAEPFDVLDIQSALTRLGVYLRHPLIREPGRELAVEIGVERRHTETFLLGQRFGFSPGVVDGQTRVTVLSFDQSWTAREATRVVALRSSFRLGVDAFGATRNHGLPDGRYLAWRGQAQWVERTPWHDADLAVRVAAQFANDPLLPSEKLAIGGASTVRGYRESTLNRDNGVVASAELRIPLGQVRVPGLGGEPDGLVQVIPFVDWGRGWDTRGTGGTTDELRSVGLGVRWSPNAHIEGELFYGHALDDVPRATDRDLQDDGLHFALRVKLL
ncbi:MAG: ShlB/FhaC/HecB family hemolysin secretion/activation protein [Ectothiorhodospiraceae bacterium]|nr:ShlB/FhaC/HecB family hemolysin secretion/activation protein [Ectothiorhodospiraceae bacterium]